MKMIFKKMRVGLFLLGVAMLAGCGGPTVSSYYNPAWTYDGKILAIRQSSGGNSTLLSGGGDPGSLSWVIMNEDGSGEKEIKRLGDGQFFQASASPSGNYIALVWGAVVDIYTYPGFDFIRTIDPLGSAPGGNNIYDFDWAPGDQKMVIRDDFGAYVYSVDGVRLSTLANLRTLSFWRYTTNIYGDKKEGAGLDDYPYIELTENDQIVRKVFTAAYFPYEPFPGGVYYYSFYKKFRLSDFSLVEEYPTLNERVKSNGSSYRLVPRPINPVNPTEVIYAGPATNTSYGGVDGARYGGIILINLDGTSERKLRR